MKYLVIFALITSFFLNSCSSDKAEVIDAIVPDDKVLVESDQVDVKEPENPNGKATDSECDGVTTVKLSKSKGFGDDIYNNLIKEYEGYGEENDESYPDVCYLYGKEYKKMSQIAPHFHLYAIRMAVAKSELNKRKFDFTFEVKSSENFDLLLSEFSIFCENGLKDEFFDCRNEEENKFVVEYFNDKCKKYSIEVTIQAYVDNSIKLSTSEKGGGAAAYGSNGIEAVEAAEQTNVTEGTVYTNQAGDTSLQLQAPAPIEINYMKTPTTTDTSQISARFNDLIRAQRLIGTPSLTPEDVQCVHNNDDCPTKTTNAGEGSGADQKDGSGVTARKVPNDLSTPARKEPTDLNRPQEKQDGSTIDVEQSVADRSIYEELNLAPIVSCQQSIDF